MKVRYTRCLRKHLLHYCLHYQKKSKFVGRSCNEKTWFLTLAGIKFGCIPVEARGDEVLKSTYPPGISILYLCFALVWTIKWKPRGGVFGPNLIPARVRNQVFSLQLFLQHVWSSVHGFVSSISGRWWSFFGRMIHDLICISCFLVPWRCIQEQNE